MPAVRRHAPWEFRTSRFGALTYTQAGNEWKTSRSEGPPAEHRVSVGRKLAGARVYGRNNEVDYDVLHYDIPESHFSPQHK